MNQEMSQKLGRREHIKSLGKGLSVLIAINELGPAKLSTLIEATALPKPTLIRMINTLREEGFVIRQSAGGGGGRESGSGYMVTPKVRRLSSAFAQGSLLAQVAQRPLNDLCEIIKWPSEILVPDGLSMVIEVGNRHVSPITLKYFEQQRFPILTSAAGKAYISGLAAGERERVLSTALAMISEEDAYLVSGGKAESAIAQAGVRGYSVQDYEAPIGGTRVYAVPLKRKGRTIAALAMPSLRDVLSVESFEKTILPRLKEVADEIGEELALHSRDGAK